MRKLIYILIIIILFSIIGAVGFYFSYIHIEKNQSFHIKTLIRPYTLYSEEGYYIFPEKLLFFNPNAFTINKIEKTPKKISTQLSIELPKLSSLKDEKIYKVEYTLSLEYLFTEEYQMKLFKNLSMEDEHKQFIEYLGSVDKQIIFSQIEKILYEQENNTPISTILSNADYTLSSELKDKYDKERVIINKVKHSYDSTDNIQLYKQNLTKAIKLGKELNEIKSLSIKADEKDKITWENKYNSARREIKLLKMYGKLFKEYPETLHYLYITKLGKLPENMKETIQNQTKKEIDKEQKEPEKIQELEKSKRK